MNKYIHTTVVTLLLSACGGGGGDSNTSTKVTPQTSNTPAEPTARFVEVPNALKIENPYENTITKLEVIDITGDGRNDIVIHQWTLGPNTLRTESCQNVLKLYVMQPDHTFAEQTVSYIQGSTDLKGCSRKLRIADLNGDNKQDLVLAMNNEDGRVSNQVSVFNVKNFALVSDGALYHGQQFGAPLWYHAVGVGYDKNDKPFVMAAGYTGVDNNSYYFDNRQHTSVPVKGLEKLSPNTFEFLSSQGPKKHTNLLLQGSNTFPNFATAEGFIQNNEGEWNKIGEHTFAPVIGIANGVSWNTTPATIPIFKYKEHELAFAGLSDSCKLRMTPNSEPIAVFGFSGQKVKEWKNNTIIEGGGNMSFFVAARIKDNKVEEVPLNIQGEIVEVHGEFECKDVNSDGYDDILRYPHSRNGLPYIYLNTKDNGFKLYDLNNFPSVATGWENNTNNNATSFVHDFDKDGYPDLLIYPHWNVNGMRNLTYKFYRGQKGL